MKNLQFLEVPAISYPQGDEHRLYTFAIEGVRIKEFASVSRISRESDKQVLGYQRPEVLSHIEEIKRYLQSLNPMLPNAIIVAFDSDVVFVNSSPATTNSVQSGTLKIPLSSSGQGDNKAGWIVDGQQRTAALFDVGKPNFYVCVVAFIAKNAHVQREQFMLVNTTKPLPRGLLYELLPHTSCPLPAFFEKRRFPAYLLERLNFDPESPFFNKIKMSTNPNGIIQDNSVLKMLENSLADGALYYVQEIQHEKDETSVVNAMLDIIYCFWTAVAATFSTAWSLPPVKSRLTHGAGIISLGFIMDAIIDRNMGRAELNNTLFTSELEKLIPACRWTYGYWEFGPGAQRKWNEIQNTPTDIRLLSHYMLMKYKSLVWNESMRAF